MRILGFSEGYHDAAATILEDGKVIFASHSERFSKIKNDKTICDELKDYIDDLGYDRVAFYERPFVKRIRQFKAGQDSWRKKRNLAWKYHRCFPHHLSHAAAAFQCSPFTKAYALIVDAIGEFDTVSLWMCEYKRGKAKYRKLSSITYPTSIGLFYSAITKAVGLKPNEEEYITMGMSAFGKPNDSLYKIMKLLIKENLHRGIPVDLGKFSNDDIAYCAQLITEKMLSSFIKNLDDKELPVVYGGGVALNCLANGKIFKTRPHYIFPNPGDAGSSLGAAALMYGGRIKLDSMFLGYDMGVISTQECGHIVDRLQAGEVIGVAAGKAEFGPRALGNRSLLADPRTMEMKNKVNEVKKRQKFRPFAPAVLEEHARKHYELFDTCDYSFMQYVVNPKTDVAPACEHVDRSARLQTVSSRSLYHSPFRDILQCWYARTRCPILLNTSLNIRGMPMVNDTKDANDFENEYGIKVFHGNSSKY